MTCTWEADPACLGDLWTDLTDEERDRSLMLATSSLQTLTLGRVGTCPITIRPCPVERPCGGNWEPYILDGRWLNTCGCRTAHWCSPLSEVDLPGPVGYIESIKVDGAELPLGNGDWRLDDGHLLVWQGIGPSPIPETQNLNAPDTAVGTWSITYSRSYPVGADARMAVAMLAMEFAKACKPKSGKCSLPRGVQSVARAGVTFTIGDKSLFPGGLTGIDVVDQFILKWAPAGAPNRSATVFSPRTKRPRVSVGLPVRSPQPPTEGELIPDPDNPGFFIPVGMVPDPNNPGFFLAGD